MTERCPKCGSELEENIRAATYGGPLLVCPLDPKETEAVRAALKGVPPPPRDEQGVE